MRDFPAMNKRVYTTMGPGDDDDDDDDSCIYRYHYYDDHDVLSL